MKVALKYCGGCDPAYDRVAYFQRIARAAGGRIAWTTLEAGDYRAALILCGCLTACPAEELPLGPEVLFLKDERLPPAEVVARLLEKGKTTWTGS
ncbi:MAG: hypothetical protein C4525_06120 [Desulfarculus sp.]|jgi:hypothetical protein|nr:MAG: hypothetical protein C4525_06120 [Desulfarculus sp.]